MEPRDHEKLLSGAEPKLRRNWLSPVEFGRRLTEGSVTPALGTEWHLSDGLWVPIPGPQPINFAFVYLVLSGYVPSATPDAAAKLVSEIVATAPCDEMLLALVQTATHRI